MSFRPQVPGEIYEDKNGNRWLVISICNEPTVRMQRIEPAWNATDIATVQHGGMTGMMWDGFKKVLDAPGEPPERTAE